MFLLGCCAGALIVEIKWSCKKHIINQSDKYIEKDVGETQFIESISFKEKFDSAKNITDLIK